MFLDRDGTISEEVGYLNHISRFRMLAGTVEAIRKLNDADLPVIVVTNQSGVGRGYFPESLVREVNEHMAQELARQGAKLAAVYYCPHSSVQICDCRKPKTGMLELAAGEHNLDLASSFVVGDRKSDIELAHNANATGILVRTGYGEGELAWHVNSWTVQPHHIARDLMAAVNWILER